MTDWKETSEVAAINRGAGGPPVAVSAELIGLREESLAVCSRAAAMAASCGRQPSRKLATRSAP